MILKGRHVAAFLVACAAATSSSVAAARDIDNEHVTIEWDAKSSRTPPKGQKKSAWKTACKELGKSLSVGQGLYGFGAFATFTCTRNGKRVFGGKRRGDWVVKVVDKEDGVSLTATHLVKGEPEQALVTLALPASDKTMRLLAEPELADLVAFALLDAMPMAMQVDKTMVKDDGTAVAFSGRTLRKGTGGDARLEPPEAPEELALYRLAWDEDKAVWRAKQLGYAKRTAVGEEEVTYAADRAIREALAAGPLWAHNEAGPRARGGELAESLRSAHRRLLASYDRSLRGRLSASLLDTTAAGYVGVRYGLQVLRGEKLMSKTSFFGLLAEIRGGPLKGLRYYFDYVPPVHVSETAADGSDVKLSATWSRHVLGVSFGLSPGLLVDRVTLTPKLGVWAIDVTAPSARDEEGRVVDSQRFRIGKVLGLGLEGGVEWLSSWYTLRAWAGIDSGVSLLKSGARVTSRRGGIDAYFTAGPSFSLLGAKTKTALLAFFMGETVTVENDAVRDDPGAVEGTELKGGFAGLGVAVSW